MFKINDNYQKLPGSYLFSTIAKKVNAYSAANPEKQIIRLGIGDVTQPIAPAIIDAMHKAVDEMGHAETFHGYAPDLGYDFLRNAIVANDYKARASIMWAGTISHNDLTGLGRSVLWQYIRWSMNYPVWMRKLLTAQDFLLYGHLGQDMYMKIM